LYGWFLELVSKPHLPALNSGTSHRIIIIKGLRKPNGCVASAAGGISHLIIAEKIQVIKFDELVKSQKSPSPLKGEGRGEGE
jgi:hypothetical protein